MSGARTFINRRWKQKRLLTGRWWTSVNSISHQIPWFGSRQYSRPRVTVVASWTCKIRMRKYRNFWMNKGITYFILKIRLIEVQGVFTMREISNLYLRMESKRWRRINHSLNHEESHSHSSYDENIPIIENYATKQSAHGCGFDEYGGYNREVTMEDMLWKMLSWRNMEWKPIISDRRNHSHWNEGENQVRGEASLGKSFWLFQIQTRKVFFFQIQFSGFSFSEMVSRFPKRSDQVDLWHNVASM